MNAPHNVRKGTSWVVILFLSAFVALYCHADDWKKLGDAHASHNTETDKIDVNSKTAYRQVKSRVEVEGVYFKNVRIVFDDGEEQNVAIGPYITAGNESRSIDLKHGPRKIAKVYLEYGSRPGTVPLNLKQGKVIVYARQ